MANFCEVSGGTEAPFHQFPISPVPRRALNQLADSQRLAETAPLRRAAQLLVFLWVRLGESAGQLGGLQARRMEARGHGRLARIARNFAKNLREEVKKIDGSGRG